MPGSCEASNGQEWENIVTATADNLDQTLETGEQKDQKRYGQKYGLTALSWRLTKLQISIEWQVGDGVSL
ncbi:MAG: hypothetical protein ACLUGJ_09685 [Blautia wexlerae]